MYLWDTAIPLLGQHAGICELGNMHKYVQSNIIDKNHTLETTQMPTDRRMGKLWNSHPIKYQMNYRNTQHQ